ncbi:MAG TPA: MBL fold metallo-hydrolase [Candidatus Limnocylindrales bacterium]|nr:MBL fold metallo-hydrolase [Candidatus Limnocylindrales bacterium]
MRELRPGLWHWQAPHPDWTPDERWPQIVSSYAIDDGKRLILVDPLRVPDELLAAAPDRAPVILLTAPWHERDAQRLVERLGARIHTPRPHSARYLMETFGLTAEQAGDGSPDLLWLRDGDADVHWYAAGDTLPIGARAFPGRDPSDLMVWVEDRRALLCADSVVDFGRGFGVNPRPQGGPNRDQVADILRPLLDLPIEVVLPAHGLPTDRAGLERALTSAA